MVNPLFYHIANQRHVSSHTKIFIFTWLARYQNRLTHPANERVVYHRARGGRVIWVLSSGANTDPSSATSSSPSSPFTSSSSCSSSSPHPPSSANQPSPAHIFTHTSRSLLILGDFSNTYTRMFIKHRLSITSEIID